MQHLLQFRVGQSGNRAVAAKVVLASFTADRNG